MTYPSSLRRAILVALAASLVACSSAPRPRARPAVTLAEVNRALSWHFAEVTLTNVAALAEAEVARLALIAVAVCPLPGADGGSCSIASEGFARAVQAIDGLLASASSEGVRLGAELAVLGCRARLDDSWERTKGLLAAVAARHDRIRPTTTERDDLLECSMRVEALRSAFLLRQGELEEAESIAAALVLQIERRELPRWDFVEPEARLQLARCFRARGATAASAEQFRRACDGLAGLRGPKSKEASECRREQAL